MAVIVFSSNMTIIKLPLKFGGRQNTIIKPTSFEGFKVKFPVWWFHLLNGSFPWKKKLICMDFSKTELVLWTTSWWMGSEQEWQSLSSRHEKEKGVPFPSIFPLCGKQVFHVSQWSSNVGISAPPPLPEPCSWHSEWIHGNPTQGTMTVATVVLTSVSLKAESTLPERIPRNLQSKSMAAQRRLTHTVFQCFW